MTSAAALLRAARPPPRWARTPSCAFTEQPARSEQQHEYEDDEDADLTERFTEIESREAFADTDEQSADERARDRAHTAEHHDGKGDQHERVSGTRIDVVGRQQQTRRDCKARGAEAERHGVDVCDIDASEFGAELLPGDGADRLPEIGPLRQQP